MKRLSLALPILTLFTSLTAAAESFSPKDYDAKVLPVLQKYCVGCHNADDPKGGLVMDDYHEMLAGGEHGAPLVAGKSEESLMILLVEGKKKPKMPPKDNPVPSMEEVALLRRWIDAGAPGPAEPGKPPKLETPKISPLTEVKHAVRALAHSPKDDLLAVARDNLVHLVQRSNSHIVRSLEGHTGPVTSVQFSKDGALLIVAAGEPGLFGEAILWNIADGKRLKEFHGHADSLYAAVLSPDGKWLATAGYDKDIKIWDVDSGKELRTLKGHNDAVFDLCFSPNGKFLASSSGDRTVKLWDVQTGERLDTFAQSLKEVYTVAFSPDGQRVAAGGVDNRIRVWTISESGKEGSNPIVYSTFAHQSPILKVIFSPDGQWLFSSAEDRSVKVWKADTMTEQRVLDLQSDWPDALTTSQDGKALLVGRHDGALAVYDVSNGSKLADLKPTVPPPVPPELLALSTRGIERGKPTKVRFRGKNLAPVNELHASDGRIVGKLLSDPAPADNEVWFELTANELPRGTYQVAVASAGGKSKDLPITVDDIPQIQETAAKMEGHSVESAIPASFWGTIAKQGETDRFVFEAAAGQTIVLETLARELGSKLNPVLTVFDPDGRVLATSNNADGSRSDPVLAVSIAMSGKHVVAINDLRMSGSNDHFFRVSVGNFAYVTGVFPLSVPANSETPLELVGFNLPANSKVQLKAPSSGNAVVPLDQQANLRFKQGLSVSIETLPEVIESEPNDMPDSPTALTVPGVAAGRISSAADGKVDADLFRFQAKAGEQWILETDAARRGSPIDTAIEVLDAKGNRIERVWLQATRDSYIEFRNINAVQGEARVKNWEEMELNEYLYLRGEVCKIFRMPRGPDSGFLFYLLNGVRRTYFDTTATAHAVADACYIVTPHPPGTELVPNGLPVFKVYYANDDSGDRKLGSDSRVTFTAPADGDYLAKVIDVGGQGGASFAYRLKIDRPRPDFSVRLAGENPVIHAESGKEFTLIADRVDGFDGPIQVDVTGLPPGFSVTTPIVIESGHVEAQGVVFAQPGAVAPTAENQARTKVIATAQVSGATIAKEVNSLGTIKLADKPKVIVRLEPEEVTIAPGGTVAVRMKVERNGFNDRISFDVNNLPHGVIVDNIGLNGILIPENQTERTFFLNARNWVPETSRPFHAVARVEGNQCSPSITLHVKGSRQLATVKQETGAAP
ncbi:MAG: c-type cytochrome domain-containing protein [Planctomycetota bacterium]